MPSTSSLNGVTRNVQNIATKKDPQPTNLRRRRRIWTSEIDDLFEAISKPTTRRRKQSSTLERRTKEGKKHYISTKADDGSSATHLIKIEIYDLKKLSQVPVSQRWKYATVKAKYYSKGVRNKHLKLAKKMLVNMADEISKSH